MEEVEKMGRFVSLRDEQRARTNRKRNLSINFEGNGKKKLAQAAAEALAAAAALLVGGGQ